MIHRLFFSGSFLILLLLNHSALASDTTLFFRIPSTLSGLRGLLLTQSIDTLPPKTLEVGLGASGKNNNKPNDFTEYVVYATTAMGLTPNLEVAAQIPYMANSNKTGKDENNGGDVNLSLKWRFLEPSTDLNFPGFALSLTAFFPTGDPKIGAGAVDSWGLQALIVSSAETEISFFSYQMLMGFYADGGIYFQDSGDLSEEQYGLIDLGVLVPLNETRQVQLLLEGNFRVNRQTFVPANANADYTALTPSLRYVTKNIALTAGWQHRFNEKPNDDSDSLLFQGSYSF